MNDEAITVRAALNNYKGDNIDLIRSSMADLIVKVKEIYGDGKENYFKRAQCMIVILNRVLIAKSQDTISLPEELVLKLGPLLPQMQELFIAMKQDERSRVPLNRMLGIFSGECIGIASEPAAIANRKYMQFLKQNRDNPNAADLPEAKKLEAIKNKHEQIFENVGQFCSKYRVNV